jgi:hypothetical protein
MPKITIRITALTVDDDYGVLDAFVTLVQGKCAINQASLVIV